MRWPVWLLGFALLPFAVGLDDGLALTPVLGWNSWNSFHDNVSESLIKETADLLVGRHASSEAGKLGKTFNEHQVTFQNWMQVSSGLAGVGFNYVVIDGELHTCLLRKRELSTPAAATLTSHRSVSVLVKQRAGAADGWAVRKRAVSGPIAYNITRFPSGMPRSPTMCTAKVKSLYDT